MKRLIKILIVFALLVTLAYVSNITMIPDNIILFQGEKLNIKKALGINLFQKSSYETMQTSISIGNGAGEITKDTGKIDLSLNLFNNIKLKDVSVNVIPKTKVVPVRANNRYKAIYKRNTGCWLI